jgi:hypothetical protein
LRVAAVLKQAPWGHPRRRWRGRYGIPIQAQIADCVPTLERGPPAAIHAERQI